MKVQTHRKKKGLLLLCFIQFLFVSHTTHSACTTQQFAQLGKEIGGQCTEFGIQAFGLMGNMFGLGIKTAAALVSRPDMLKMEVLVAGIGAMYGLGSTVWNRLWLHWVDHNLFHDGRTGIIYDPIKIYKWGMENYPTAGTIKQNRDQFRRDFEDAWNYLAVQNDTSVSWNRNAVNSINREIADLQRYLRKLEGMVFYPSRACDQVGIDKIFQRSCDRYRIEVHRARHNQLLRAEEEQLNNLEYRFHRNLLNPAEELQLDNIMHEALKTTAVHWLCFMPNFGKASQLYWTILKRVKRLEAMRDVLRPERPEPARRQDH